MTSSITAERPWPYGLAVANAADMPRAWSLRGMGRILAALMLEHRARRATRHLMALDDYMLRDMGISRADIDRVVRIGRD